MASTMKFCPDCHYYMALKSGDNQFRNLSRVCINCNRRDVETKGGLLSEMKVQQKSSEAFKIMINEFTRQDNTLPHIKMIPCPRDTCPSNVGGVERDVIYMTYDNPGKKNLYICNVCGEQWKSRS
uniref:DNA-directed RNA polymerase M/15kDa subunit domain-containing protein n=1 Tax=viral metagenome TaxID=1070528 RepID=A0A6C0KBW3_9ZZZZ